MTDTNAVLNELRELLGTPNHSDMQRMRVAELFHILDTALSNGERMPDDWSNAVRPMSFPQVEHFCVPCGRAHSLPLCNPKDPEYCKHGST